MILSTPSRFSLSTSAAMLLTSSSILISGPGEATSGVSLVTAPTMPIFWPPTSSTTEGLMRSPTLDLAVGETLALTTGKVTSSRNGTSADSPSSNSWLPTVMASNFIWFRNSASALPL